MQFKAYTKEFNTNLKIAFPIMLGQLGHILVALVDNLMVGELGAAELAAVSLGNSLIFIALSLGIGFSFAITPLVAEADGTGNTEKAKLYLQGSGRTSDSLYDGGCFFSYSVNDFSSI